VNKTLILIPIVAAVGFLLIPFSSSYAENAVDVKTLFEKGFSAIESSNFEDALYYFDQVLEVDPSHIGTLINKGIVLKELDRYEEALSTTNKALETNPLQIEALINKSSILVELDRYEEALSTTNKLLEIVPLEINALNMKGGILIKLDRHEEALPYLDQVLEIDPSYTKALNNKGVVLAKLEQYLEAIAIFEQILEIDPYRDDVLQNQYNTYGNIIHLYPNDSKYLMNATIEVRDPNGALAAFQTAKKIGYLPHHLTDKYLDSFPVIENVVIDNQVYEKIVIVNSTTFDSDSGSFISHSDVFTNEITSQIVPVLRATHWGIPVVPGDTETMVLTVFRLIE